MNKPQIKPGLKLKPGIQTKQQEATKPFPKYQGTKKALAEGKRYAILKKKA